MAILSAADRTRIWRGLMRYWSGTREPIAVITKADLQAAVDATDGWIDTNAAAYNLALPLAARTNLSATQKTLLFCAVSLARTGDLSLLRRIVGEVD